ncbi:epoxide hydrolase 4 isoform X6 [Fopius arisanus]|uniref:Epoxide hydrolase 4 isoform X6 n=1 Tax=Fopius arisanus TaxID=64838 RepID=A0A9R1TN49_9HYME|nr:PREDICTED: epoxide hydrolase 4-like isoform X6 [Fopius arisanus]
MTVKIIPVSLGEEVKLHLLSFIFGIYLIIVRMFKWAWNPKKFFGTMKRDKPPPCLIDDSLGKHFYVKVKGTKFHYVEAGRKDKPLVLLLHGFPDCWLSWRGQIPVLAEYYRVVALDLKGFGDSDKPTHKKCYKIEVLMEELHQFILTFGVNQCSIIGHDLGGLLGWYMTAFHNNIIHKFVAISSPHPNYYWNSLKDNATFGDMWLHFSRLPFLPEMDALKEDLSIIDDIFTHININQASNEMNYVEAYKYAFSRTEDWTGPINYYRNLPFMRLYSIEPVSNQTLLVVGNADSSVSLESVIQSSDLVARFNIKVITGAQHFPHQEKPDMVNQVILNFLIGKIKGGTPRTALCRLRRTRVTE